MAKAVLDRDNIEDRGKVVPFLFNHTLSCVTFSANYDDEELAVGINPMVPYSLKTPWCCLELYMLSMVM